MTENELVNFLNGYFAAYDKGYKMNAGKIEIYANIHDNPDLINKES